MRSICSMNRQFQLTCLRCSLKIHHNNEYWETKRTLSLRQNHYGSHFLPFLARWNHFGGETFMSWQEYWTDTISAQHVIMSHIRLSTMLLWWYAVLISIAVALLGMWMESIWIVHWVCKVTKPSHLLMWHSSQNLCSINHMKVYFHIITVNVAHGIGTGEGG